MTELTDNKDSILSGLKDIKNFAEISAQASFNDWLETVFGTGLLALDNVEVYTVLMGRTARLETAEGRDLAGITPAIKQLISRKDTGIVAGVRLPQGMGEGAANEILRLLTELADEDADILLQAVIQEGPIRVFILAAK